MIFKEAPRLQGKYLKMRQDFALTILNTLADSPHTSLSTHADYLRLMGYRDYELKEALENFIPQ